MWWVAAHMVAPSALENAVPTGYPQYQAFLNTSASLEAPEWQHNQLNMLLHTFFVSFANQGGRNSYMDSVPPLQINEVITTFESIYMGLAQALSNKPLVRAVLEYCSILWNPSSTTNCNSMQFNKMSLMLGSCITMISPLPIILGHLIAFLLIRQCIQWVLKSEYVFVAAI